VRLVIEDARATKVKLNGAAVSKRSSLATFNRAPSGWYNAGRNLILIKSGITDVSRRKVITVALQPLPPVTSANLVCDNGWTTTGESIRAVGNTAALGNWDPEKGIKLNPSVYYEYIYNPPPNHNGPGPNTPKWTGLVSGLPAAATVEWKCVKKTNAGQWQLMPGENKKITLPGSGFAGTSVGTF
jgi:alpha-glucosidase